MTEKVITCAKASPFGIVIGAFVVVFGVLTASTCLVWETILGDWAIFASAIIGGLVALVGVVLMIVGRERSEIVVTDKRVYGKTLFGKRVDLPIGSVSAVAVLPLFSGVVVSTSSGRISFYGLPEYNDLFKAMSTLIVEREGNRTVGDYNSSQSDADQLKKYKDLLDGGVISQEEFDAKKKQLLGL